ncbi:MAG TPA: hypothetical protein VMF87_18645 [Streptosporangiaceae bacterium]|nr:hypothetical protein [Streptosporangiaceae bacterium]
MSRNTRYSISLGWWVMVLAVAAAALLFAWLGRLAGVPLATTASIGVGGVALAWLIVLVTVPWNLYFSARRVAGEIKVSRERGIAVPPAHEAEAGRIARRMLWFALGAHSGTAAAAAVIAVISGAKVGYYFAGFFLLSAAARPAAAYLAHVRYRINTLTRETTHPRDDVASLKHRTDQMAGSVKELRGEVSGVADGLRRAEAALAGDIAHARDVLTADLARVQDAQAADRAAARTRDDDLGRRIDEMVRRIEATLDGISDHQELITGIRALVRMIKPDPA